MLVDLETARRNLKQLDTSDDDNIVVLLQQAEDFVLALMDVTAASYEDESGNPANVPPQVTGAILLVLRTLYDTPGEDPITPAVRNLLLGLRDPVFA